MANVIEAVEQAVKIHGCVAARPTGLVVRAGGGGRLYHWSGKSWTPWVATTHDLAAQDWETGTPDQIAAALGSLNQEPNRESS